VDMRALIFRHRLIGTARRARNSIKGAVHGWWQRVQWVAVRVSSRPSHESYSWGPERSSAAFVLYYGIFLVRLLSPLQWLKFRQRHQKQKPSAPELHSSLESKPRPDFHAADTEYYLFSVLVGAIILWSTQDTIYFAAATLFPRWIILVCWIGWGILLVFLIESIQWTFYYALFRPLIERAKLNLYDEAEYLVMLPVVILTQLFLLSVLWHRGLEQTALILLNVSDPSANLSKHEVSAFPMSQRSQFLYGALLGESYIVIVIASLIRVVPTLHVRKRPSITVIGYGDVVRNRILPALLAVYDPIQLAVASLYLSQHDRRELTSHGIHNFFSACEEEPCRGSDNLDAVEKITAWVDAHSKLAILATPTPSHLEYILRLADRGVRFALEKPIVGTEAELDLLASRASKDLFADIFVLSYYWLEKGLSLNYLLTLNPHYLPLLECKPDMSLQGITQLLGRLGRLRNLTTEFLEGEETPDRFWTEVLANGGMVMETLVHPFTFAVNFARNSKDFSTQKGLWSGMPNVKWRRNQARAAKVQKTNREEIGPTFAEIHGSLVDGASVDIRCGKYIVPSGNESRFLIATYEHGWITSDLSNMVTRIVMQNGTDYNVALAISNRKFLKSQKMRRAGSPEMLKYQHQIDLLNSFFIDGWGGLRFDDYPSQLEVLRELVRLLPTIPTEMSIRSDNDVPSSPWVQPKMMTNPAEFEPPSQFE